MKKAMALVLAVILLSGCTTPPGNGETLSLLHKVRVEREGTRSESRHGYLIINGQALPDNFYAVQYQGRLYRFSQRNNLWGDDGYFPVPEPIVFQPTAEAFGDQDLARGWYDGEKLKVKTPADWLFVEWRGGRAFVAHNRIAEMIRFLELPLLERYTGVSIE